MVAFRFPSEEALRAAITGGFVSEAVLPRPVVGWRKDEELWVSPRGRTPKGMAQALSEVGVPNMNERPPSSAVEVDSWFGLIAPVWRGEPEVLPDTVLFRVNEEGAFLAVAGELLRLGCDRQELARVPGGHLLRALHPPYYTVTRTGEGKAAKGVTVFLPGPNPGVWLEYGYEHPLAPCMKVGDGTLLFIERTGKTVFTRVGDWRDVYSVTEFVVKGAARKAERRELEARIEVEVRLVRGGTPRGSSLWVSDASGLAALERLLVTQPEATLQGLRFAAGESRRGGSEGEKRYLLQSPRDQVGVELANSLALKQAQDRGLACAPHPQIPHLYLPVDARLEPPLRTDKLRELLAPEVDEVVWLEPAENGGFDVWTIADDAFLPLRELSDYVIHSQATKLVPWVESMVFELADLVLAPGEGVVEGPPVRAPSEDEPAPQDVPRAAGAEPTPNDSEAATPTKMAQKVSQMPRGEKAAAVTAVDAAVGKGVSDVEAPPRIDGDPSVELVSSRIRALEAALVADQDAIHDPERWAELARAHAEEGNRRDAGLAAARWMWQVGDDAEAATEWAALECHGEDPGELLRALVSRVHPLADETRTVASLLWSEAVKGKASEVDVGRLGEFFERHDTDLDVRSRWLARLGLTRLSGGDPLALSRLRDRVLHDLRSGLSLTRDVPTFLRGFASGLGDETVATRLRGGLSDLEAWFGSAKRRRGAMEAPEENTQAYVSFGLAYGFARLGEANRARQLMRAPGLDLEDPIHGFLVRAYQARVEQALNALTPTTPLPAPVAAELNQLARFARYKVDRLREVSTILEPVERLDAVRGFETEDDDPRGATLAGLRDLSDPAEISRRVTDIVHQACRGNEPIEVRARVMDGVMDFFFVLPASQTAALLDSIAAALGEVEPSYRVLLLEEALMNAGLVGHEQLMEVLLRELQELLLALGPEHLGRTKGTLEGTLRTLRRVGWRDQAEAFLNAVGGLARGDDPSALVARVGIAGGLAHLGNVEAGREILGQAQVALAGDLSVPCRLQLVEAQSRALNGFPLDYRLGELASMRVQLVKITDGYSTNSHFCLSVIQFMEALVLGYTGGELGQDGPGRQRLDEDEALVRQRIHRDVREALQ